MTLATLFQEAASLPVGATLYKTVTTPVFESLVAEVTESYRYWPVDAVAVLHGELELVDPIGKRVLHLNVDD